MPDFQSALDDLVNVKGLEVIELTASVNGPQTFTFDFRNFTEAQFRSLVGEEFFFTDDDILIIRATPLLAGSVSQLNINVTGADQYVKNRIQIEQSADLNVNVIGGPLGLPITTALFYTPNVDRLPIDSLVPGDAPFIPDGATVIAYQLGDVQTSDYVNANEDDVIGQPETIQFRFAVSNSLRSLEENLNFTQIYGIDRFVFQPAAVNQAVSFDGIDAGGFPKFALGLDSIITSGGPDRLINIERSLYVETGGGNDTVDIDKSGTVVSGSGNDFVTGSRRADSIVTGQGDDYVSSGKGDDFIDGGTENNTLYAGAGNDTVTAANGDNFINTAADGLDPYSFSLQVLGNNSEEEGYESDNDSVLTGTGKDTILVGLGSDTVRSGGGNDIIVLANSWNEENYAAVQVDLWSPSAQSGEGAPLPQAVQVNGQEDDGLSPGDVIDGGAGFDLLAFEIDDSPTVPSTNVPGWTTFDPNTVGQPKITSIEALSVNYTQSDLTLELKRNAAVQAGGTLNVLIQDNDDVVFNSRLTASEFTVAEKLIAGVMDLEDSATVVGGAGNDQIFTVGAPNAPNTFPFNLPAEVEGDYTYVGGGGADTINLLDDSFYGERVGYFTANDGGNAGDGLGGDLITGFRQTRDIVAPFNDIEDKVVIGGALRTAIGSGTVGSNLDFIFNGFADFDSTPIVGGPRGRVAGLILGNGVSDGQTEDTAWIANRINGLGIESTNSFGTNAGLVVVQGATQSVLYAFVENGIQQDNASSNELFKLGAFEDVQYLGGIDANGGQFLITTNNVEFDSANFVYGAPLIA